MSDSKIFPVKIPRQTTNDDTIFLVEWLAADAQAVRTGDAICTLESSKATFEFTAPCDGFLHIIADAGRDLPIGHTIAWITQSAERPPHWPNEKNTDDTVAPVVDGDMKITAKARSLLQRYDIDAVVFAGMTLVRERNVIEYVRQHPSISDNDDKLIPHSHMHMQTAKVLTKSFSTIPHSYLTKHVSAYAMESAVEKICTARDILISLNDMLVYCVAGVMKDFPKVNSTWLEAGLLQHREVSVGVAINQADGTLVVPVIRNADTLDVTEIAGKIRGFQKRSIRNRLSVEDLTGGHFSITSLIGSGVCGVFPIIYPGQAAILAIGDRWGYEENEYYTLTIAFDHRILNGVEAARFMQAVCDRMLQEKQ